MRTNKLRFLLLASSHHFNDETELDTMPELFLVSTAIGSFFPDRLPARVRLLQVVR